MHVMLARPTFTARDGTQHHLLEMSALEDKPHEAICCQLGRGALQATTCRLQRCQLPGQCEAIGGQAHCIHPRQASQRGGQLH